MGTKGRVRAVVATAGVTGIAGFAVTAWLTAGRFGGGLEIAGIAMLFSLTWLFPLLVLRREETEALQLDEAFFVAMALLLPPLGMLTVFAAGSVFSQIARRRPLSRIAFNTGMLLTSASLGLGAMALTGSDLDVSKLSSLGVAVLGAAVFFAANATAVSAVMAVVEGERLRDALLGGIGFRILVGGAATALGLLAAIGGASQTWALLFAVFPLFVLNVVLSGSMRARRDRERIDGLLRAAMKAHASIRIDDVEHAIASTAGELLKARSARVERSAPGAGEIGSRIGGGERWLVVGDRRGVEGFGSQDRKLLDAIAAVGASALQNADLVDQIKHQSFHDALTGLPNRPLFEERLGYALAQSGRNEGRVGVYLLDLDRFKKVNDSMGHAAGNELLKHVAARLGSLLRTGDTVARLGGDEFALLLPALTDAGHAAAVARKILDAFTAPFKLGSNEVFISPSIGVAVTPDGGTGPATLLRNADAAMYQAKQRGRNTYEMYTSALNERAHERLLLEAELHNSIDTGGFTLVYQPQIDLTSGRTVGVEALVRWPHPERGLVSPDNFIPLAEESGLIVGLDAWVLREATRQIAAWDKAGLPPVRVAVNLSARAFEHPDLIATVEDALSRSRLDPSRLELELTETATVAHSSDPASVLQGLRDAGVQLAIDDFGTGYSTLARLRDLPVDRLKIDRTFVSEIGGETTRAPMVDAMVAMGHGLKLEVVAEGVETAEQAGYLKVLGCDLAQGYFFGRPAEAKAVRERINVISIA